MKILVGSQALAKRRPGSIEPKDTDYFSDFPIPGAETFYHPALETYPWAEGTENSAATLDELYTIKVSHAFWELRNGSWGKHMKHTMFLKELGANFIPELYAILYKIWEERHGVKPANLEQEAEDFFGKTVTRIYEHDSIHAAIAYGDAPLFEKILRDGHGVAVSKEKFDNLSEGEKLNLVREEVFATALERQVIPADGKGWRGAYPWALKQTITSYSKGWFPLYIVLNFEKLCKNDVNYWQRMLDNGHLLKKL